MRASWTANQRGLAPWRIGFDARGDNFASGYPELDRLLGRGGIGAVYEGTSTILLRTIASTVLCQVAGDD